MKTNKELSGTDILEQAGISIKKDAESIVIAVYSHKTLLYACKSALTCLTYDSDMEEDFAREIKQLKQAINKAESKKVTK